MAEDRGKGLVDGSRVESFRPGKVMQHAAEGPTAVGRVPVEFGLGEFASALLADGAVLPSVTGLGVVPTPWLTVSVAGVE